MGKTLSTKLKDEEADTVVKFAKDSGMTTSSLLRIAVQKYLKGKAKWGEK